MWTTKKCYKRWRQHKNHRIRTFILTQLVRLDITIVKSHLFQEHLLQHQRRFFADSGYHRQFCSHLFQKLSFLIWSHSWKYGYTNWYVPDQEEKEKLRFAQWHGKKLSLQILMMTFHCLAGIAAIWLPESKNRPLPHTMTDLEIMKQKTKNICDWSTEWSTNSEQYRESTIEFSCVLLHGTLVTFKSFRYLLLWIVRTRLGAIFHTFCPSPPEHAYAMGFSSYTDNIFVE